MRVKTGIEGLDKMLMGGLIQGRNILLSGPCGSGKSILAMQFLYNGAMVYNEPGLYVTLEETKQKFYEDMSKFGMDLEHAERTGRFTLIGGPVAGLKRYMNKVDADIRHIVEEIEEIIREKRIKRVVIDSINLLTMLLRTDDERRKALAVIANSLSAMGCTAILISETKEGSMDLSRYGMEEFVVDGVIVLYLARQGSKFEPGIVVRKMRGTKHEKEIKYYEITDYGILVHPEETLFTDIR
jgi:KaiC/GvpD/RAD55 family RecA-like ATPase